MIDRVIFELPPWKDVIATLKQAELAAPREKLATTIPETIHILEAKDDKPKRPRLSEVDPQGKVDSR
jgi:hypothetical protein